MKRNVYIAQAGLGADTPTVSVGDALVTQVASNAFAPYSGVFGVLFHGLGGYLVGRAVGAPWTVAAATVLFSYAGLVGSVAYVAAKKGG